MVKREIYNIISVPNNKPYIDYPADFPRMGRLYLEMIENKDKVKPELVNTDYVPKIPAENFESFIQRKKDGKNEWSKKYLETPKNNDMILDKEETSGEGNKNIIDDLIREKEDRDKSPKNYDKSRERDKDIQYKEYDGKNDRDYDMKYDRKRDGDYDMKYDRKRDGDYDMKYDRKRDGDYDMKYDRKRDGDYDMKYDRKRDGNYNKDREWKKISGYRDDKSYSERNRDYSHSRSDRDSYSRRSYRESSSENRDFLTDKLKSLLRDENYSKEKYSKKHKSRGDDDKYEDKYSVKKNIRKDARYPDDMPPSLTQLEKDGEYNHQKALPNYSYGNLSDKELDNRKRELLFKFEILKKQYKNANVPEFTQHSNIDTMEKTYESTVRSLHVDSDVEKWKKWLYYSFMAIEYVFSTIFNFEMSGYTQQQMLSMNEYEKCLIELGEKSYSPVGSSWPVEIRLLFMVMLNTGLFILGKMFMKKNGFSMGNYKTNSQPGGNPKRKMREPSLLPEDLPEVE